MTDPATRYIGLALMDPATALEAAFAAKLVPQWFPHEWQRRAYVLIRDMDAARLSIDPAFVADYGEQNGMPIDIDVLRKAEKVSPSRRRSADDLVWTIRREYIGRELADRGIVVAKDEDPAEKAATIANELIDLAESHAGEITTEAIRADIEKEWEDSLSGKLRGLPMQFDTMYHESGGVRPGHVCVLVGHGGAGKSLLAGQWALFLAKRDFPVLMFPFEDGVECTWKRLGCALAGVNPLKMDVGQATREEVDRAKDGLKQAMKLPITMSGFSGTVYDMAVVAQQAKARKGIKAIFIDAFKDIYKTGKGVEGDGATMNGITRMASRLRVPAILSHHVRKPPPGEHSKRAWHISQHDLLGTVNMWNGARMVFAIQSYPKPNQQFDDEIEYDYRLDLLKTNHGRAGRTVGIERDKESLMWREKSMFAEYEFGGI